MSQTRMTVEGGRFELLDALRGIAAVAVLVFHLLNNSPQVDVLHDSLPSWVLWLPDHGRNGVACFFVISGFVIAYSTRNVGTRLRDAGRFALRRQLRLDPPYYVVVLGVLVLGFVQRQVGLEATTYSSGDIVLNLVYLQDITNTPSILAVAWTLCLEVQFYLVLMLLMIVSGRLSRETEATGHSWFVRTAACTLGLASILLPFTGWDLGVWFIATWWMFCSGMVLCWTALGAVPRSVGRGVMAVLGAWCVVMELAGKSDPWGGMWTAWATGVAVLLVIELGQTQARAPKWLTYAGAVSYSLYLVHLPVIETVNGALYKVTGDATGWALLSVALGATAAFVVAHVLLVLVERPAIRWAQAFRSPRAATPPRGPRPTAAR